MRYFRLFVYYTVLQFLPPSSMRFFGWTRVLRNVCCKPLFKYAGTNINIESGAYFGAGDKVKIGSNSGIGVNCKLYGEVSIGDDVMMGPEVLILTGNHEFSRTDMPMIKQGMKGFQPVSIGNDVWIGQRVIILPGVSIGNGVVVGAGSIVTKSIPDFSIAAGNPARLIRSRK